MGGAGTGCSPAGLEAGSCDVMTTCYASRVHVERDVGELLPWGTGGVRQLDILLGLLLPAMHGHHLGLLGLDRVAVMTHGGAHDHVNQHQCSRKIESMIASAPRAVAVIRAQSRRYAGRCVGGVTATDSITCHGIMDL